MSNLNSDAFYDVGQRYFGEPINNKKLKENFCSDMCCDLQNELITREQALQPILEKYEIKSGEWYCSKEAIKGRNVKDYIGQKIFDDDLDNISGWIIMWDKQPFANWSHECEYFFVYGTDKYEYCMSNVGLSISVQMSRV